MFQILTYSWLGMIFLVFILGLFFLEFPLWLRNSQLKRLTKIAAALIKTRSPERSARETRAMVLRKLTSVKWMAEPMKRFDKAWRGSVSDDREEAFDSIFLQEFLSPSIVLPGTANRHMALVLPGMLVGLGIVGPFLGLVLGLPSIGAAPESFAVDEELRNLVGVITQSLGLAFWTSIAGIGLSLLFLFGDRVSVHLVERKVLELSRIVERIYPCLSAGEIARTQQSLLREVCDNLQTLGTDVAAAIADVLEPAFTSAVSKHLTPVMEKIRETVDKLADLSSEKQTEGLQLLVQTFMDSMNEAVGDQFGQLQQVLATTIDSQGSIREGLEEFGNQLRQVGEVQQKLISDTNRTAETLTSSLDRLEEISHTLGQAAEKIVFAGAGHEKSAGAAVEAQEIAQNAQRELLHAAEVHSEAMTNARQQLSEAWDSAVEQAKGTIFQIQEATREFREGIGDQLIRALDTFDGLTLPPKTGPS